MLYHYMKRDLHSLRERLTALIALQPSLAPMHSALLQVLDKNASDITQAEIDLIESTLKEMA